MDPDETGLIVALDRHEEGAADPKGRPAGSTSGWQAAEHSGADHADSGRKEARNQDLETNVRADSSL